MAGTGVRDRLGRYEIYAVVVMAVWIGLLGALVGQSFVTSALEGAIGAIAGVAVDRVVAFPGGRSTE